MGEKILSLIVNTRENCSVRGQFILIRAEEKRAINSKRKSFSLNNSNVGQLQNCSENGVSLLKIVFSSHPKAEK